MTVKEDDDIIDVESYEARFDYCCPLCGNFSAGEEAMRDHRSQCAARFMRFLFLLALRQIRP